MLREYSGMLRECREVPGESTNRNGACLENSFHVLVNVRTSLDNISS